MRLVRGTWSVALLAASVTLVVAQEPSSPASKSGKTAKAPAATAPAGKQPAGKAKEPAAKEPAATAEEFPELVKRWDELDKQLDALKQQYDAAPSQEEKGVFRNRYVKLVEETEKLLPQLRAAAEAAFAASPGQDKAVTDYLIKFVGFDIRRGEFDSALKLARKLIDAKTEDPTLYSLAGAAALEMGQFEDAEKWMQVAKDAGKLDEATSKQLADRLAAWNNEQEIRQKEAQADDLPRVELETSQGKIVLELFENEAPQTVANFIHLVEKKFYDDTTFHRVLPGFMAQGGDPNGTGSGGPGYTIYDETDRDNHRLHFRGSLSMAKTAAPDSGGSQFFITYRPTTHLDGKHTVFGRVIEGQEVAEKLQPRDPNDELRGKKLPTPDKLISAKVLRKREHEYVPTKVEVKTDETKGTKSKAGEGKAVGKGDESKGAKTKAGK